MNQPVVELATRLIDIESTSGAEGPMADFLAEYLTPRGWTVVRQEVAPGRQNIYATRPGRQPRLLFNSHLDTVPPYFPASRDDTWLYGRGACDTKSLIAAQLLAVERLLEEGRDEIGLLYVVGEEVDHCGMAAANELGLDPAFLIVGEPTQSKLVRRQKGLAKVRLEAKGKAAHSGYPETGDSAVEKLLDVLQDLRREDWPEDVHLGATTMNIGLLGGGRAANIVPDSAFAEVMIRVVTSRDEIMARIEAIVAGRVSIRHIASNDPWELCTLPGYETVVVSFNTDIPYLRFNGKALLWGAGSILDAHTPGEKIKIADLESAVSVYAELARTCLAI